MTIPEKLEVLRFLPTHGDGRFLAHDEGYEVTRGFLDICKRELAGEAVSVSGRRHGGDRSRLEIGPNLRAGGGLVRGGAGTALVGDAATVAERMDEYRSAGIGTFVMSGHPHPEEACSFGERVPPAPASDGGLVGEVIADTTLPRAAASAS